MNKKVFFWAVISGLLALASCQKTTIDTKKQADFYSVFSREDLNGVTMSAEISLVSNGIFATLGNPSVQMSGAFKNSSGNRIQVDKFLINNINIPLWGLETSNFYSLFVDSHSEISNAVNDLYGSEVTVEVESSVLGDFSKTFYLPEKVVMNLGGISALSKSQNLSITWNADTLNTLPVALLIAYNKGKSIHIDPNMPNQDLQVIKVVPDNGAYTIPASDLQIFPVGGLVTVNVMRGIQEHTENSSGNHALINGVTYVTTIEFEVVN